MGGHLAFIEYGWQRWKAIKAALLSPIFWMAVFRDCVRVCVCLRIYVMPLSAACPVRCHRDVTAEEVRSLTKLYEDILLTIMIFPLYDYSHPTIHHSVKKLACRAYLVELCLIYCLSYQLPFIAVTIYGVVCVERAHFRLGDCKDISIAHVFIIIKSEVSTLPIVIIFSVVVCLRCSLHPILSLIPCTFWENRDFVFVIIAQFMMTAIVGYVLARRSYYFVCTLHHLSIINVKTYLKTLNLNAFQIYFVECVIKIKYIISAIHYIRGCVFSVYPFPLWWLR